MQKNNQPSFVTTFVDCDHQFVQQQVFAHNSSDALRRFLMDRCPEEEASVSECTTVDDLKAWAIHRECFAEVLQVS